MIDERWSEINTAIGNRRDEFNNTFYQANHAEIGMLVGSGIVTVGIFMANSPDLNIACKGAMFVSGAVLAAKAAWDTFVTVPTKREEIAQGIGLTRQDIEYWYGDHDDFSW
jgi:hypothetical protein